MIKRTVDVILAGFLFALTLPLLILSAILIKLDSRGPVLFRQTRMGLRFRRFELLKLRTMSIDSHGSPITIGADPRITRPGQWLRRFKFDELPQLWNILRGDMSLVGPRPVIPELAREFDAAYRELLKVRPGLTDPASLKYCREAEILASVRNPVRYFKTVIAPDKIRISLAYMKRATMWSDFDVMLRTARILFSLLWKLMLGVAAARTSSGIGAILGFPHAEGKPQQQPVMPVFSMPGDLERRPVASETGLEFASSSNPLQIAHITHQSKAAGEGNRRLSLWEMSPRG